MSEQKNNTTKQNNYSPIILWLFPLLLLNIGWRFFVSIDRRWEEQERIEIANKETEALAANSDFSYCFAAISSHFCEVLKSDTELFCDASQEGALVTYVKSRSDSIFKSPFPKNSLVVFKIQSSTGKARLLYTNDQTAVEKEYLANTFEYLVKVNSNDSSYSNEDRMKGEETAKLVFGENIKASIFAESQRSKSSLAYYNNKSSLFLWDYFKNEDTGDYFGFIVFIDKDLDTKTAGRLLAINDLKEKQKNYKNKNYAAFIPLFPESGELVASEELKKIPEFSSILDKWTPKNIKELSYWQKNSAPAKLEDCIVNKYEAFFYTGPNQTHAAVLFVPTLEIIKMPIELLIFDIVALIIILSLILRGFFLGKWPNYSLKSRFFTTYFLAACLPLGLMIIASYGYISEYKHTDIFNNQSKLKLNINRFDNSKMQAQEEYKTAFLEILNNQYITASFVKLDKTYDNSIGKTSPEAMDILSRMLNHLNKGERDLPILSLAVIDEKGGCLNNFGNELNPTFCFLNCSDEKEGVKSDKNLIIGQNKVFLNIYNSLLKRISDSSAKNQNNSKELMQNIDDLQLIPEITDNNVRKIITKDFEQNNYSFIFDYIYINGKPRYAICIYWDESSLDEKTFISSLRYFAVNEPFFIFSAYKANSNGIKIWPENNDRHINDFYSSSIDIIKQAYFKNTIISSRDKNKSLVAVPSRKYKDVIFVGGVFYHDLEMDIFTRFWICIVVIFIAFVIFLACLHYSSIIFIRPISKLKGLLDKISEGNFDIEIKSSSKDEFSQVCNEFNQMTKELSVRKELSTLISDHAVEALSKKENSEDVSDVESFKGTVLVSDIRNFTGMCEQYSPDLITDLLDKHFAVMTRIISSNGGRIYKYVGDAIEAVFADRDDTEKTSAERAFITSCQMLDYLSKINEERLNDNLFEYKIGIGLCYGELSAGTIGSVETRLDYAIIGDSLKDASKLESYSRFKPDFPLIVNKNFVDIFNNNYPDLNFKPMDNTNSDAFYVSDKNLVTAFLEKTKNSFKLIKPLNKLDAQESDKATDNNNSLGSVDVEENFSFWRKFIPGSIFVITLAIIMSLGIYFVYTTAHNSEKIPLSVVNNRTLSQIICEEYAKTIFDIKCRDICIELQKTIDKVNENEITENFVSNSINQIINSDKSLNGIEINKRFVNADSFSKLNLSEKAKNATIDAVYNGRQGYLFWFDFYKDNRDKPVGYLVLSAPSKPIMESIPLLLSAFSKNEALVILKDKEAKKWYFSDNVPEYIKDGVIAADKNQSVVNEKDIRFIGNEYLYDLLGVTNKGIIDIGGKYYDLYLTRLCKLNKGNPRNALFWVFVIIVGFSITLWKVSKGTSRINTSIAAKLWVALLIVAVIPVVTVFFVFGLFRSEYYYVKCSVQRAELQKFEDLFEQKYKFYSPIGWNYIKTINESEELKTNIKVLDNDFETDSTGKEEHIKTFKTSINSWVKEITSKIKGEEELINFSIENVMVAGKNGWKLALLDDNKFNRLLGELADLNLKVKNSDISNYYKEQINNKFEDISLSSIKSVLGDDKYIGLIHNSDEPVYIQLSDGFYGLYSYRIVSDNSEGMILWVTKYDDFDYLKRLSEVLDTEYMINISDCQSYGCFKQQKDEFWRLALGGYANWISTSNNSISDYYKYGYREWYCIDGKTFLPDRKGILLLLSPEKNILNEIIILSVAFYLLLGISLLIIIHNTRNIADDIIIPINSLISGIREVKKENFAYRIDSDRTDELGALCLSFDKMIKGLDEKRLMSHMLSNTAKKVASKEGNISVGKTNLFLLYIGIPNFSSFQKEKKDNEIFASLTVQTSLVAGIIMEEGGEVDKIIGERLLAVFPEKNNKQDSAKAVYNAAKRILELEESKKLPFSVSIGINYGEVINGFLGIGNKRDFTVIGDAVNITARIEGLAENLKGNRCLLSNTFNELISGDIKTEYYGEVELKGKSQPMKVYSLV